MHWYTYYIKTYTEKWYIGLGSWQSHLWRGDLLIQVNFCDSRQHVSVSSQHDDTFTRRACWITVVLVSCVRWKQNCWNWSFWCWPVNSKGGVELTQIQQSQHDLKNIKQVILDSIGHLPLNSSKLHVHVVSLDPFQSFPPSAPKIGMLNSIESDLSETSKFDTLPKFNTKKRWLEDNFPMRKGNFSGAILNLRGGIPNTHRPFLNIRDPPHSPRTWIQHMRQQATQHMMDPIDLKKQGAHRIGWKPNEILFHQPRVRVVLK